MRPRVDKYSEAVVLRVNELFHDLTSQQYARDVETEMVQTEGPRWVDAWKMYVKRSPVAILDIGTGSGFVPLCIGRYLNVQDRLVCSDVSKSILAIAEKKLAEHSIRSSMEFVKLHTTPPFRLPFGNEEFDVITMNSVLHHLKDTQSFLSEVDRVLAPNGVLMIGHEPNRRFRESLFMRFNYQCMRAVFLTREAIVAALRKVGLYEWALKLYYRLRPGKQGRADEMAQTINEVLLSEGLVKQPLRAEEIPGITDIRDDEGFEPNSLLSGYRVEYLETYNHLLTVSVNRPNNPVVRWYGTTLQRKYPNKGATFFAVYKKNAGESK